MRKKKRRRGVTNRKRFQTLNKSNCHKRIDKKFTKSVKLYFLENPEDQNKLLYGL